MKRIIPLLSILLALCTVFLSPPSLAGDYTRTRYPIVLVHGLFGFDTALGLDYFYGIPAELREGGARVFVAQVSATNSNEVRGEQLLAEVERILAMTGADKVNLIGHSQGAPTVRYVAAVRPDIVASATSVGGVNGGSRVADLLRAAAPPGSPAEALAARLAGTLAKLISLVSGNPSLPQVPTAALNSLTTAGMERFNRRFPEGLPASRCGEGAHETGGVRYYSWSGTSGLTNVLDITDPGIGILSLVHGEANDGLVSRCSSHLGQVIRSNYAMNHLDEVNQMVGLVNLFEISPVTLFRQHANRLKEAGL
ncbi:esterase/lipase family protein [Paludibacterium paludis]|uniref:Lipase n=1 Tax=Paludibacterium paludis TaxID=1225769 RepID=A0A918P0I9_9NEIS|nr:triacylglycerol lipase [Paludibacterium paludis]GGY11976.1 lipase [Paludibacterium paludis]